MKSHAHDVRTSTYKSGGGRQNLVHNTSLQKKFTYNAYNAKKCSVFVFLRFSKYLSILIYKSYDQSNAYCVCLGRGRTDSNLFNTSSQFPFLNSLSLLTFAKQLYQAAGKRSLNDPSLLVFKPFVIPFPWTWAELINSLLTNSIRQKYWNITSNFRL